MLKALASVSIAVAMTLALAACGGGGSTGAVPVAPAPQQPGPGSDQVAAGTTTVTKAPLSWAEPAGVSALPWHWTATNPSGSLMVATAIPGGVYLSRDQGQSWTQA